MGNFYPHFQRNQSGCRNEPLSRTIVGAFEHVIFHPYLV